MKESNINQSSIIKKRYNSSEKNALSALIRVTEHQDFPIALDKRIICLTLNLKSTRRFAEYVRLYRVLCEFLSGHRYIRHEKDRPGLILSGETGGERFGRCSGETPHWHGILVLSKAHHDVFKNDFESEETLQAFLEKRLRFIKQAKAEWYQIGDKSLLHTVKYYTKSLELGNDRTSTNTQETGSVLGLLPNDLDTTRLKPRVITKLDARFEVRFQQCLSDPSYCFTKAHLDR